MLNSLDGFFFRGSLFSVLGLWLHKLRQVVCNTMFSFHVKVGLHVSTNIGELPGKHMIRLSWDNISTLCYLRSLWKSRGILASSRGPY